MPYRVFCSECDWSAPTPVDLKGEANWLAGRHISETGHHVSLREVGEDDE